MRGAAAVSSHRFSLIRPDSDDNDPTEVDRESITGIQRGDEEVFATLVTTHVVGLTRYAFSFLGDEDAAHDIVQDIFARIWQLGPEWNPRGSIQAYLLTAVRHRALDTLRNARTRQRVHDMIVAQRTFAEGNGDPYIDIVLTDLIRRGIQSLTPRQQDVLRLRYGQGLPVTNVAQILGVDVRSVERLIHRALAALRELVPPPAQDTSD